MGRPRKPSALLEIEGGRVVRADRPGRSGRDLEVLHGIGSPPPELNERERKIWSLVVAEMPPYILRRVDQFGLSAYCTAVRLYEHARDQLNVTPMVIKSSRGQPMRSPWLLMMNRQSEEIIKWGAQFGLSPLARTHISMSDEEEDDDPKGYFK